MHERFETRLPVSDVFLNVVEQGDGPPIVLLHGFPEFSFSWNSIINTLSSSFYVVAPDQRGYGNSDIPTSVQDYQIHHLVDDIVGLIRFIDRGKVVLVGHDWGATVAWVLAQQHPDLLRGLMVLNGPHPAIFARELSQNKTQRDAAGYINHLLAPGSESLIVAQQFNPLLDLFAQFLETDELERYRSAYALSGSLRGMLNWYQANFQPGPAIKSDWLTDTPVELPTHVVWGMADSQILPSNLEGLEDYATNLTVTKIEAAGHWLLQEMPDQVGSILKDWAEDLP